MTKKAAIAPPRKSTDRSFVMRIFGAVFMTALIGVVAHHAVQPVMERFYDKADFKEIVGAPPTPAKGYSAADRAAMDALVERTSR